MPNRQKASWVRVESYRFGGGHERKWTRWPQGFCTIAASLIQLHGFSCGHWTGCPSADATQSQELVPQNRSRGAGMALSLSPFF